ncbi:transglutaminase-like cysteine peptidase [Marinobacterium litorale]|uniref:transglutaminase-like cysteine peptidase n=1 Tax=Marinobacterium litorale TaxID=404770 RepID=UPI001FE20E5B|nr:transglutaminase-like cysteine peptidase [Marinobacterium litorale]
MQLKPRDTANSTRKQRYRVLNLSVVLSLILALASIASDGVRLSAEQIAEYGRLYGDQAQRRLTAWQKLMSDLADAPETEKLERVNAFFNQVRFLDDIDHWRQEDYWATPVEFLISNGGDCEDFSIAKYYTLNELGVDVSKMSLAYVKALELNQAHMVLTYYPSEDAVPLVLDNLIGEIKTADQRPDLLHVYTFNGDNLWLTKRGRRSQLVGSADRLKPWVQVQSRIDTNNVNVQ